MKTLVALQPSYMPWSGYFDQIDRADIFVHYDDVQFDKQGWRNRNRIKAHDGVQWLTVPVRHKKRLTQRICNTEIDGRVPWGQKHLRSIEQNYARAKFLDDFIEPIRNILNHRWARIADLDITMCESICDWLGVSAQFERSSELKPKGDRNERLVEICRCFNVDCYLTGAAAVSYLDVELFKRNGIRVEFQRYEPVRYEQLYDNFIPYLSVVDLIMNCGPASLEIIRAGRK
jgi:hypothetical protein